MFPSQCKYHLVNTLAANRSFGNSTEKCRTIKTHIKVSQEQPHVSGVYFVFPADAWSGPSEWSYKT